MWTCAAPLAGVKKPWLERGVVGQGLGRLKAARCGGLVAVGTTVGDEEVLKMMLINEYKQWNR